MQKGFIRNEAFKNPDVLRTCLSLAHGKRPFFSVGALLTARPIVFSSSLGLFAAASPAPKCLKGG